MATPSIPEDAIVLDSITIVRYMSSENSDPIVATNFGDTSVYDAVAMLGMAQQMLHESSFGRTPNES